MIASAMEVKDFIGPVRAGMRMDREEPPPDVSGAKQIPGGGPDRDWGLLDLEQYAQAQHQEIVAGEATLAPAYWRLGQALNLIRHQRGQGAWGKYLESLGIHRVRACKARSIARHFLGKRMLPT